MAGPGSCCCLSSPMSPSYCCSHAQAYMPHHHHPYPPPPHPPWMPCHHQHPGHTHCSPSSHPLCSAKLPSCGSPRTHEILICPVFSAIIVKVALHGRFFSPQLSPPTIRPQHSSPACQTPAPQTPAPQSPGPQLPARKPLDSPPAVKAIPLKHWCIRVWSGGWVTLEGFRDE